MDPLTAFSIATGVAQLIDFSSKVIKLGLEFRSLHGELPRDLARVDVMVGDLRAMMEQVQHLPQNAQGTNSFLTEQTFASLITGCLAETRRLHVLLESLRVSGSRHGPAHFLAALRAMQKAGEIAKIEEALDRYRNAISARLVQSSHLNQQYIFELLDRNREESSRSAVTIRDTLSLLDSSITNTTSRIENDINSLVVRKDEERVLVDRLLEEMRAMRGHVDGLNAKLDDNDQSLQLSLTQAVLQLQSAMQRQYAGPPTQQGWQQGIIGHDRVLTEPSQQDRETRDKSQRVPVIQFTISISVYGNPKDLVDMVRNMLFTSWSSVFRIVSGALANVHPISPRLSRMPAFEFEQITSLIRGRTSNFHANYDGISRTVTASDGQTHLILQMSVGVQEQIYNEAFINPSFFGLSSMDSAIGHMPRVPSLPPQIIIEEPPDDLDISPHESLSLALPAESNDDARSNHSEMSEAESLLFSPAFAGMWADTSDASSVDDRPDSPLLRPSTKAPDFALDPNILPIPSQSSVYIKEDFLHGRRRRHRRHRSSTSSAAVRPMTRWERTMSLIKVWSSVFLILAVFWFVGRWIDGDTGFARRFVTNPLNWYPDEYRFLYHHRKVGAYEATEEELRKLRLSRAEQRRRNRRSRPFWCYVWGSCTDKYWDEMPRTSRQNKRKTARPRQ